MLKLVLLQVKIPNRTALMAPIIQVKQAQQDQYLRSLKDASPAEKAKIALQNSGFASFARNNRSRIVINFSR